MNKICSKCNNDKPIVDFYKHNVCRSCKASYDKSRRATKLQEIRAYDRKRSSNYKRKEQRKKSNLVNRDSINQKNKERAAKLESKIKRNKYLNDRKKNDINFRLTCNLRNRLRMAILGNQKSGSAVSDLGCSIYDFRLYLESKFYNNPKTNEIMSWDNWILNGWHIDHIIPLSKVDLSDRQQFLRACHYSNLQPLWSEENLSKGNKYEKV